MTQLWHSVLAILRRLPATRRYRRGGCGLSASPGKGGVWLSDDQGEPVGLGIPVERYRSHELMSDLLRRPGLTAAISPIPAPTCSPAIPACSCTG